METTDIESMNGISNVESWSEIVNSVDYGFCYTNGNQNMKMMEIL